MSDSPSAHLPAHPAAQSLRSCEAFYEIAFDPVPLKARHDGWTPERQRGFIDRLVVIGSVAKSARAVGMSPQSAHALRSRKGAASFAAAWDRALASGRSYQIDVAIARSIDGERIPVMYKGRRVGERVRTDNSLVISVLNAMNRRAPRTSEDRPAIPLERYLREMEAGTPPETPIESSTEK